jgi:hypothetical protein
MQGDLKASKIWQNQGLIAQHHCKGRVALLLLGSKQVVCRTISSGSGTVARQMAV